MCENLALYRIFKVFVTKFVPVFPSFRDHVFLGFCQAFLVLTQPLLGWTWAKARFGVFWGSRGHK